MHLQGRKPVTDAQLRKFDVIWRSLSARDVETEASIADIRQTAMKLRAAAKLFLVGYCQTLYTKAAIMICLLEMFPLGRQQLHYRVPMLQSEMSFHNTAVGRSYSIPTLTLRIQISTW